MGRASVTNDLIIRCESEPDGEGWFECRVCGLHTGFLSLDNARRQAEWHDTTDCAMELEWTA